MSNIKDCTIFFFLNHLFKKANTTYFRKVCFMEVTSKHESFHNFSQRASAKMKQLFKDCVWLSFSTVQKFFALYRSSLVNTIELLYKLLHNVQENECMEQGITVVIIRFENNSNKKIDVADYLKTCSVTNILSHHAREIIV